MTIVEDAAQPKELFHGTLIENMIMILESGIIEYRDGIDDWLDVHDGVSLTTDKKVAWGFSHTDTHDGDTLHNEFSDEDGDSHGAVFHIDPSKVHVSYVRYNDSDAEAEWRTHEADIPLSAVTGIEIHRNDLIKYLRDFSLAKEEGYDPNSIFTEKDWNQFFNDPKKLAVMAGLMNHPLIRLI